MRVWSITCHSIFAMVIAFFLLIGATASPVLAGHDNDGDKTIPELAAKWWQWAYLNGFPDGGAFKTGNIDCSAGQDGDVWFLAGFGEEDFNPSDPPGEGAGNRKCRKPIPPNTKFFFPLVNFAIFNPDDACGPDQICTVPEKREIARGVLSDSVEGIFSSRTCFLTATLDSTPVIYNGISFQRTQSPPFRGTGAAVGDDEVITDGVWVLLPELKKGKHIIDFTGAFCSFMGFDVIFGNKVRYELRVGN